MSPYCHNTGSRGFGVHPMVLSRPKQDSICGFCLRGQLPFCPAGYQYIWAATLPRAASFLSLCSHPRYTSIGLPGQVRVC